GDVAVEELDRATVGRELSGDEIEQRRLAGAVGADDEPALARLYRERHSVGHAQAAEGLVELFYGERGHRPPSSRGRRAATPRGRAAAIAHRPRRAAPGTSPSGMKMTIATKIAPSTKFHRSM